MRYPKPRKYVSPIGGVFFNFKGRTLKTKTLTGNDMVLFFIGILEMLIITTWTKMVTKTQVIASGVVTLINIFIWYYVLQVVINNINNWQLVLLYATGCAVGTMASTYYFSLKEKGHWHWFGLKQNQ